MARLARLLVLIGLLSPLSAFADGFVLVRVWDEPVPVHVRRIRVEHPPFAPLAVAYHQVEVKIEDQVALTQVEQEFVNPSATRLEGTYIFPLPPGAQIERFSMFIDGKEQEAELLPAEKARAIYEDIVRRARDPALMEYAGRDVFKVRIFPIEPHGRKKVRISYRQVLKAEGDLMEYVYPLNTEKFSSAPIERVSVKVEVAGQTAIRNVYSPSHKVEVKRHDEKRATVGFEEKGTRPDADFHLFVSRDAKAVGLSLLTYRPDPKQDGYFALLASPSAFLQEQELSEKDVVFVLDTSGSMAGAKMEQARRAMRFCVDNLNEADRFEIIRFSTEAEGLFGGLKPADKVNRGAAAAFVEGLKPIGGTAIDEALQKALAARPAGAERPFMVVFLTDGQPTVGETAEDAIVGRVEKANASGTRIFCFGIGTDLNTHLLDRITEVTRASGAYVLPEEDIEVKVSAFFLRIKSPVLTQARLVWGDRVKPSKLYPGAMPDLFRGDQVMAFGRYSGSGPVTVTLEGTLKGKPASYVMEGTFPDESRERPWVARLWAARRVGYLLDEIRLRGESLELKDEVTALAREFGIVTPYTAYLILEDEKGRGLEPNAMTLREFAGDTEAQDRAQGYYQDLRLLKAGRHAVEGRNETEDLKMAAQAPAVLLGKGLQHGGAGGGNYAAQARQVGTKTFYRNGAQWSDSELGKAKDARRVQIRFGSEEYFALARRLPEAAWLALGPSVHLVFEGSVYEITE